MSNREPVTKDIIWQRSSDVSAPIIGATVFACLLSGVTVWFSGGAIGPWLALLGLGVTLMSLIFGSDKSRDLFVPLCLGLSGLALGFFSGGFTGAAVSAVLWPILGVAAVGGRISNGIGTSLCVLLALGILASIVTVTATNTLTSQSGILALGVCGAMAVAACVRLKPRSPIDIAQLQIQLIETTKGRDAALVEAQNARAETKGRSQFMAEMSHEIRTPLNAILGFADTMREGVFGPIPAAYGDYPDLIHTSGSHLLDLVSDLLDLSKIEAGRYETHLKTLRLDEVAYEGVRLSSGAARAANVQIRHEAGSAVEIKGDARAMRQIVFNLMSNAIKFTPKNGRVILRVAKDPSTGFASLEVEDTGVGISLSDLDKIGQPWNQANNGDGNDAKPSRGSGLGLALVKRLTDLQGGTFDIESALGAGTRVRVSFPLALGGQMPTPPTSL